VGDRRGGDRHCDHVLLGFALNFPEHTFRNCPKSLGGAHCVAVRETETVLFGPCRAPYTAKYGVGALLVTLFGQFLPDVGKLCVMVPIKTENWLHFSARLADGTPEVHFELTVQA
jgi:hypothetical protein